MGLLSHRKAAKIQYSFNSSDLKFHYRRGKGHALRYVVDRMIWKWYPKLRIVRAFPEHVDLELSSVCNMRCPMCYTTLAGFNTQQRTFMDFDLYKRLIDECAEGKAFSVRLSIRGEPLLHPRFMECVRYAKGKGIREVSFLTNALLLNEAMAREIVDAGVDWVTISFDGLGSVYNTIRKPAQFEEALQRVKDFVRIRNERGLGKPAIQIQTIWDAIKDDPDAFLRTFNPIVDMVAFNMYVDFEGSGLDHDPAFLCHSPWERLVVYADGSVPKCINDPFSKDIIGDANASSLRDIWRGEAMRNVRALLSRRKRLDFSSCRSCSYGVRAKEVNLMVGDRQIQAGKREGEFDVRSL